MKQNITFLGDTTFHEMKKEPDFHELNKILKDSKVIINLEAPITNESKPIKNKISLKQEPESVIYLKKLNPYLVNLGNNHINDYDNKGVVDTKIILEKENINFLGAGKLNEEHNVFIDETQKIAYFSYVSRESDLSSPLLFETETTQGPKELCTKTFIEQSKKYKNYEKVLLIHWGEENINYPLRSQRVKAKELINAGADLIIGTHPHVIQGYEQYKNKYIFYSLGNFFFPDTNNKTGKIKRTKTNKTSIIPIFNNKLKLEKILTVYHENNNKITLIKNNNKVKKLSKKLHFKYYQILIVYELIKRDVIKPIIKKVIK